MLHGILFFYVVVANFTASKNEFKISCAQNVPKFLFFTEKCAQKRLRGNLHEALGITDEFSTATLVHLFRPLYVGKSST